MKDSLPLLLALLQKRIENLQTETETLTFSQYTLLQYLTRHQNPSVGKIAQALGVSNPAATKALDRLVLKGYIERKENPEDRRTLLLNLSETGLIAMREYQEWGNTRFERILAGMRPEEKRAFKRGIRAFLSASIHDDHAQIQGLCLHCGEDHSPDCLLNQASLALLDAPMAEI